MNKFQSMILNQHTKNFKKYFPEFAKKNGIVLNENWFEFLNSIIMQENFTKFPVIFYYKKDSKYMNANSGYSFFIRFNQFWALELIKNNNQDEVLIDTFKAVIGHEESHKIYSYLGLFLTYKSKRLVNYTNELIADVRGMYIAKFNEEEKRNQIMKKRETYSPNRFFGNKTPPAAITRTEFVKTYHKVSKDLILAVAIDLNCKNKLLINYLINKYSPYFTE